MSFTAYLHVSGIYLVLFFNSFLGQGDSSGHIRLRGFAKHHQEIGGPCLQSQLLKRLKQKDHLSPGVQDHSGQYSETPVSTKNKNIS